MQIGWAPTGEPPGWWVDRLVSTLNLWRWPAELFQEWRIVADGVLDELLLEVAMDPDGRPQAHSRIATVYGAQVGSTEWSPAASGRRLVSVQLPEPLEPGQVHEFGLSVTAVAGLAPTRHLLVAPARARDLELRTRFRPGLAPVAVRVLEGVAPGERSAPPGPALAVDRNGEAVVRFGEVEPGLAYGIGWTAGPAAAASGPAT